MKMLNNDNLIMVTAKDDNKKMLLFVMNDVLFQALITSGLGSLAKDPDFVSVTKKEMADAMHTTVDHMESMAQGILSERSGSIPGMKKRRPIPVPPPVPTVAAKETAQPDPAVRRKRRQVPVIPSSQESAESNSQV